MSRVDNTGGSGFTVDNGTGLVVRTKLNQIVAALSTLNQGSGDPSIGVAAYVPHIDGNTLKIRNAANNAFVSLGDVSATNFGHAGLSAANTFTSTNIFQDDVTFDGATAGRDIVFDRSDNALEFADNASLVFGAGSDLTITHDATDSTITSATNDLKITSNGDDLILEAEDDVIIRDNGGSNILAQFINGGANELYHNATKKFETASGGVSLTGGAAANVTALSDGATITVDMATACHHSVTLGGNRTFAAPSNQVVGQSGSIFITQDGTGSRTASFNAAFKFVGGTAPTLTTTAAAVDRIDYIILSSNVIHCAVSLDVK
tara:strand:- start:387 stop:1346 length:960 start_codon:yes stop_codon:yes gene_type:complete